MVAIVHWVPETFTVAELCSAVAQTVEDRFSQEVWATGAISGLSRSAKGHAYFDLVEPDRPAGAASGSVMPVALFAGARSRVNTVLKKTRAVRMADGVQIKIRGRVTFYPPQSRVQLVMSQIDPTYSVAQMVEARQILIDTLKAEGVLGANHALEFPVLPLTVALITSVGSAAHADFIRHIETSGYGFDVRTFDVRVQGRDAPRDLSLAITEAESHTDVDVIVMVRGGGARSDLVAFDHEQVARAITRCQVPVIAGIGHETDRSVADEVSHLSTKTPTAAAGALIDAVRRVESYLDTASRRLSGLAGQQIDANQRLVDQRVSRLSAGAESHLALSAHALASSAHHLDNRARRAVENATTRVDRAELRLRGHDPAVMLGRGWAMTRHRDGTPVRSVSELTEHDDLVTTLVDGTVESKVLRTSRT